MSQARRGEVWWADTGGKRRPVVVISADAMNRRLPKVVVIPGTTTVRGWPDELLLPDGLLPRDTVFCCREIAPLESRLLIDRAGSVSEEWLEAACSVLSSVLGCR